MNVQELWNLFSLCGTACVRSTRFVNLDFAGPIFFLNWFFSFTWGFVLKWRCQVLYQKWMNPESLDSGWIPTFSFTLRSRRHLIFGKPICCKFRSVVFKICHLLIFFASLNYCLPFELMWCFLNLIWRHQVLHLKWMYPENFDVDDLLFWLGMSYFF